MEHFDTQHGADRTPQDLAAIVLADERARRRHDARRARDRASVAVDDGVAMRPQRGYDARSALVLAVVVAALAAVIGWFTTVDRDPALPNAKPSAGEETRPPAEVTAGDATPDAAPDATTVAATGSEAAVGDADADAPAVPQGIDLALGRITAARSGSGGGIIRFAVANRGSEQLGAEQGVQVSVLLDGQLVGERTIGQVPARGAATGEVSLDYCPSGRHALVAVVDPRGLVAEVNERDNATSRMVSFGC